MAISAFRMSGSYLLDEDDLEFTAGKVRYEEKRDREVLNNGPFSPLVISQLFLYYAREG